MTDARRATASLVDRIRPIAAGATIIATHFLADTSAFVLGEEAVLLVDPESDPRRVSVHDGAILDSVCDGTRIVSGGDDGKVMTTNAAGETHTLATDPQHRW